MDSVECTVPSESYEVVFGKPWIEERSVSYNEQTNILQIYIYGQFYQLRQKPKQLLLRLLNLVIRVLISRKISWRKMSPMDPFCNLILYNHLMGKLLMRLIMRQVLMLIHFSLLPLPQETKSQHSKNFEMPDGHGYTICILNIDQSCINDIVGAFVIILPSTPSLS